MYTPSTPTGKPQGGDGSKQKKSACSHGSLLQYGGGKGFTQGKEISFF